MKILTEASWLESEGIFVIKSLFFFKSFDQIHSGLILLTIDTK